MKGCLNRTFTPFTAFCRDIGHIAPMCQVYRSNVLAIYAQCIAYIDATTQLLIPYEEFAMSISNYAISIFILAISIFVLAHGKFGEGSEGPLHSCSRLSFTTNI